MDILGSLYLGRLPGVRFRDLLVDGVVQKCAVIPLSHPAYYMFKQKFHRLRIRVIDFPVLYEKQSNIKIFAVEPGKPIQLARPWLAEAQSLGYLYNFNYTDKKMDADTVNPCPAMRCDGSICIDDIPQEAIEQGADGKRYLRCSFATLPTMTAVGQTHVLTALFPDRRTDRTIGFFSDEAALRASGPSPSEGFDFTEKPSVTDTPKDKPLKPLEIGATDSPSPSATAPAGSPYPSPDGKETTVDGFKF